MINMVSGQEHVLEKKEYTFIQKLMSHLFCNVVDEMINQQYNDLVKDSNASYYLRLLKRTLEKNPLAQVTEEESNFEMQEVIELFEEFLNWLPSKIVKEMLEVYYHNYFATHFYCCREKLKNSSGIIYYVDESWPFIAIEKVTFMKTFLTLVHEMGHVLFWELGNHSNQGDYKILFSEIPGLYLEQLAMQFAIEKGYKVGAIANACNQYHSIEYWTKCCQRNMHIIPFFHSRIITQDYLKEIYSYLGATELFMRYQKDYEKQLYDFIIFPTIHADNLEQYLRKCYFNWRENKFQKVKEYRNELQKYIQKM